MILYNDLYITLIIPTEITRFLIIMTSFLVIRQEHPIMQIITLALLYLEVGLLYILLKVEFFAILTCTIGIGGVIVLFLFIIMLFDLRKFKIVLPYHIVFVYGSLILSWFINLICIKISLINKPLKMISFQNEILNHNIYDNFNPYNILIIKAPDLTEQLYSGSQAQVIGMALYTEYWFLLIIGSLVLFQAAFFARIVHSLNKKVKISTIERHIYKQESLLNSLKTISEYSKIQDVKSIHDLNNLNEYTLWMLRKTMKDLNKKFD